MQESTFQYTELQRRVVTRSALWLGAWGAVGTVWCFVGVMKHPDFSEFGTWATLALPPILLSALVIGMTRGRTRIDSQGLQTRSLWRRRRYSWIEVERIDRATQNGRGNTITRVLITPSNGRPFKLPAPYDSAGAGKDPDFARKLQMIRHKWQQSRKRVQPSAP